MIVMIDNFDSFTQNLVHMLGSQGQEIRVVRNEEGVEFLKEPLPSHVVLSPGPCSPADMYNPGPGLRASTLMTMCLGFNIPFLGVCWGHQALGHTFGGTVIRAQALMHGKTSPIYHDGSGIFQGLPSPFIGMRYHSLAVARFSLPSELRVTAWTEDGEIMGLEHNEFPLFGIQFHPESIGSDEKACTRLITNFLELSP